MPRKSGARRRLSGSKVTKDAQAFLGTHPHAGALNVDITAANELRLWAENTASLHGQYASIMKNVARRLKNGSYDPRLAPKLWMYWVDNAARAYEREFGAAGSKIFDKPTREYLARELAVDTVSEAPNYL